jgi:hypothetical protein
MTIIQYLLPKMLVTHPHFSRSCFAPIIFGYFPSPYWFVIVWALAAALWHWFILRRETKHLELDTGSLWENVAAFSPPYLIVHTALYSMSRLAFEWLHS